MNSDIAVVSYEQLMCYYSLITYLLRRWDEGFGFGRDCGGKGSVGNGHFLEVDGREYTDQILERRRNLLV